MDWLTFIKWNGIVYASYYGVNLLVDYMNSRGHSAPNSPLTQYDLRHLVDEDDEVNNVRSSDFLYANKGEDHSADLANFESEKVIDQPASTIGFNSPIERQGIPIDEFLLNAKAYSQNINF
jgi:hypothetical protein